MNIKGRCNSTGDLNGGTLAAGAERHEMWPAAIGHIPSCGRHRAVHPLVFNYENGLYLRNAILHIKLSTIYREDARRGSPVDRAARRRSEERRAGTAGASTCRDRWSPYT